MFAFWIHYWTYFRESDWYQKICNAEQSFVDINKNPIFFNSYKIDIENIDSTQDLSMKGIYNPDSTNVK